MFSGEDRTRIGRLDPGGRYHRWVKLRRHPLVTMLQFKSRSPRAIGLFIQSCRSVTGRRRLSAVLVTRRVGFCVGRRPIGVGVTETSNHRRRRAVDPSVLVMLGSRGDLDGGRSEQRRTENRQDYLSHRKSPSSALSRDKRASRASAPCPPNSDRRCELLRSRQSRSGEQNCWSRKSVGLMFGRRTEVLPVDAGQALMDFC